jgi:hypothetical protein
MTRNTALTYLISLLTLAPSLCGAQVPATPGFTISATDITMPFSDYGSIPFTLTSVNGFAGSVSVICAPPIPPAGVKEPGCTGGPVIPPIALAANATATGVVSINVFEPLPGPTSSKLNLPGHGAGHGGGMGWALGGVGMLGLGFLRKRWRLSTSLLLTVGMLIGLAGISACSGAPVTLTPGAYTYTLTAATPTGSNPSFSASTTVKVTVPAGVVVHPAPAPI